MLNRILERSLSGKAQTLLLVCFSPSSDRISETTPKLEIVQRTIRIDMKPEQKRAR
jgi:hypothetical protein